MNFAKITAKISSKIMFIAPLIARFMVNGQIEISMLDKLDLM